MQHGQDRVIGLSATLVAFSVPDSLLSYAGKLLFAAITAVLTSYISQVVGRMMKKDTK